MRNMRQHAKYVAIAYSRKTDMPSQVRSDVAQDKPNTGRL